MSGYASEYVSCEPGDSPKLSSLTKRPPCNCSSISTSSTVSFMNKRNNSGNSAMRSAKGWSPARATTRQFAASSSEITSTHLHIEQLRAQLVLDAGAFLSPQQQAALMLFLPEFNRQIRDMMRQARQRHRGERRTRRERRERREQWDAGRPPGAWETSPE